MWSGHHSGRALPARRSVDYQLAATRRALQLPLTEFGARPEPDTPLPPTFSRRDVTPDINACGIYTELGDSRLSPGVWAAMSEASTQFVKMVDLLETAGVILAGLLGAEAGRVTPGAAASIVLIMSATMTGTDGGASDRLSDTAACGTRSCCSGITATSTTARSR